MSNFKRHESLRCLFASVASVTVMDWMLKSGQFSTTVALTPTRYFQSQIQLSFIRIGDGGSS